MRALAVAALLAAAMAWGAWHRGPGPPPPRPMTADEMRVQGMALEIEAHRRAVDDARRMIQCPWRECR